VKEEIEGKTKDRAGVIAHLNILQDIINRLANTSSNCKAFSAVIYTIMITVLISINKIVQFWWILVILTLVCAIFDAYYLALERMFRKKYKKFVDSIDNKTFEERELFRISPKNTDLKLETLAETMDAVLSFSIIGYYGVFIIMSCIIKFM
jgi:hypothetical protein